MEKLICDGKLEPALDVDGAWLIACILVIFNKEYRFTLTDNRGIAEEFSTQEKAQKEIDQIERRKHCNPRNHK